MSLSAARLAAQGAQPSAMGQTLALDAGGVVFELGARGALDWTYDGLRPQLQFTFDGGRAIAAFQDAPARGVSCAPGSFMLLSPGMRARIRPSTPLEMLSLTYPADVLAGHADLTGYIAAIAGDLPITTKDPGVRALAMEARRALIEEADPDRRYMAALGKAMLARALQAIDQGAPPRGRVAISPFKLRRVVDHIEARLDSKISVQELAELAGLSSAHFTRAFRQATGEAPHHFILDRRVARVRELLRDPALNLATVAARAGFASHAHMSSVFRRRLNLTPAAYRAAVAAPAGN
jgi:AraC family transcriptional regulator